MKLDITARGFGLIKFQDANGINCSLQESSACQDEGLIWLGTETKNCVQIMRNTGWETINLNEHFKVRGVLITDRMHLTQSQVKNMLPYLKYFAKHGVLPDIKD